MFRSYFKIAWRNMIRSKGYSTLNILGLATGMGVALLIGLWVYYQYSYDRFLPGYQQAYQVGIRTNNNGVIQTSAATSMPLSEVLSKEVPGIRYVARTDWMGNHALAAGDKKILMNGALAGEDDIVVAFTDHHREMVWGMPGCWQQPHLVVKLEAAANQLVTPGRNNGQNRVDEV